MRTIRLAYHSAPFGVALFAAALAGCASTVEPLLYPNSHYSAVGEAQAQRDIDSCKDEASKHADGASPVADAAKNTAIGAAAGGAIGAVGGAVTGGGAGTGAIVGAAIGGTAALVQSALQRRGPDPVYKAYVDKCLKAKGYDIVGWD